MLQEEDILPQNIPLHMVYHPELKSLLVVLLPHIWPQRTPDQPCLSIAEQTYVVKGGNNVLIPHS